VVTVKLLERVGIEKAIQTARLLGIKSLLMDDLSLALGSSGVTLLELTSAYGVFANGGVRVPPFSIRYVTDNLGNVLDEHQPQPKRVLDEGVAYLMASLLQGVVENGTGWRAKQIGRPLAGKTGTTNKYIDAWFLGFTPRMAAGVWIGMDDNTSLGAVETGSRAASPIWVRFMKEALQNTPIEPFAIPEGIIRASVDAESGLLATDKCEKLIVEDFISGTQPTKLCDRHQPTGDKFLKVDLDLARQELTLAEADSAASETDDDEFIFD
jgi:penicillin-binding protein 1A